MAQTQKYEKVAIFASNLDKEAYPDNRSTNFNNRVFPIQQYQEYDSVVPMMASVPTAYSYLTIQKKYIDRIMAVAATDTVLLETDLTFLDEQGEKTTHTMQIVLRLLLNLPLTFEFLTKPVNPEVFFEPVFSLRPKPGTENTLSAFYFGYNQKNQFLLVTNRKDLNTHKAAILDQDQVLKFFLQTDFISYDVSITTDDNTLLPAKFEKNSFFPSNWTAEDKAEGQTRWDSNDTHILDYFQPIAIHIQGNPIFNLPDDFYTKHGSGESTDDEQIYIHNNRIEYTRIANQNEPIYQDMFLDEDLIKLSRITDYVSLPMHIALNMNSSLLSFMNFEFLNGVGEENNNIDKNRATFVLCKFIKKYYDFSDGKKKINIPDTAF